MYLFGACYLVDSYFPDGLKPPTRDVFGGFVECHPNFVLFWAYLHFEKQLQITVAKNSKPANHLLTI